MLTQEQLLEAFEQLTNCCYSVNDWILNHEFHVIYTNCPKEKVFIKLLELPQFRHIVSEHDSNMPLVVNLASVLSWIIIKVTSNHEERIHIKGPFFSSYKDEKSVDSINKGLNLSEERGWEVKREIWKVPMLTNSSVLQLALMMYYAIFQKKIFVGDIVTKNIHFTQKAFKGKVTADQFDQSSGAWAIEQEIVDKVRNGATDIDMLVEKKLAFTNRNGTFTLEYARQNVVMLLTLISRAAVEGGYPQKSSFSLSGSYRTMINSCMSIQELSILSNEMMYEYARRVRRAKSILQCSGRIRLCCEYIETHLDDKITLEYLARKTGYSVCHLSRKFKEEVGCSIVDYINKTKIEQAKKILTSTLEPIEEISGRLGFGSRSYFSSLFKEEVGETPTQYRINHTII